MLLLLPYMLIGILMLMSSGSNLAGAGIVNGFPFTFMRRHWQRKYAWLYHSGMPLHAAIQCRSSLDEQRKLHGKHGLPFQKLPKRSQGCLLAMHLAQLISKFWRNSLF